jgi:two-component system sensor histidine kinase/response regulator
MAPRIAIFILWLLTIPVGIALARNYTERDSVSILHSDSVAFNLFLANPDSAIQIANAALADAEKIHSQYLTGFSLYILSKSNWTKGNFKLSAEFGFKALKIFEHSSFSTLWGKCLLSLGRTFTDLHNFDQGRSYIEQAAKMGKQNHDDYLLAETYREKSMLLTELRQYDSALYYADLGTPLFEKFGDSTSVSILFSRKSRIYFYKKDFKNSSYFNRRALLYDSLVGNRRALGISYYQSALDAVHLQRMDTAILFLKKSIPINKQMHNLASLAKVYRLLADIYLEQGKKDLSITNLKLSGQYKDSLYAAEKSGQIQEMQSLYELSTKEQTIAKLEQENTVKEQQVTLQWLFVIFLLVCIILLGIIIFVQKRYRVLQEKSHEELSVKNQSIEQQKEEIQSQAETLQNLNQLKTKLFSVISHDLRGPLATLHALLDLLTKKRVTQEEFISISDKVKSSLDVTQRTLENLLNWSLSQMEGIKTEPRKIDIRHFIEDACTLMGEPAQSKNVSIENQTSESVFVSADADQVQLILRNLIHNAIKFSKPFDQVCVSAHRNTNFCLVSVKDSGIGMTKTEIETVVSSKHHFSKTGTMQEKGTGLGLLLCQEFIKLNGGEINIRSTINQGTEIIFSLPLYKN